MPTISKVNSAKNIKGSIRYARDSKDKQGHLKLHDKIGINCNTQSAENDFESTNFVNNWNSRNHVQLKKFVLGFGPLNKDTLSAKEAHIYAERLLSKYNEMLGGGWRIAAYAHHDHPSSYHYHVLIDNCNIKSGQKLTSVYKDVDKLRNLNDRISKSFGIKPIHKSRLVAKDMNESKGQKKAQKNGKPRYSYQDHVRVLISKAMLKSKDFSEFKKILKHNNANLKSNFANLKSKTGTIIIPSIQPNYYYNHDKNGERSKRKVRTGKLGLAFDKKNIMEQLSKPINQRDNKYMSVYKKYSHTPNSVILKHINITPFIDNDNHRDKTSNKYLNVPIVRNRFKTKGETNFDQQSNLVRTIKNLNRKFEAEKPISKRSERPFVESSSKINKKERQIEKAERAVKRPIESIRRPEEHTSIESSIRRSERAVERAKQQARTASTNQERKSESVSASQSTKISKSGSSRKKQSSSKREQKASPGQQRLRFTYNHFGVKAPGTEQHKVRSRQFISQKEQRRLNGYSTFIQRSRENIKRFKQIRWKKLHQKLSEFQGFYYSVKRATQTIKSAVKSITRNVQSRFDFESSKRRNQFRQGSDSTFKSSVKTSSKFNQSTQLSQLIKSYTTNLKSLNAKDHITLDNTNNDSIKIGDKVSSSTKKLKSIYDKEDQKFLQEKSKYEHTHSDTYSEHLDKAIARQNQHNHPHRINHGHQIR